MRSTFSLNLINLITKNCKILSARFYFHLFCLLFSILCAQMKEKWNNFTHYNEMSKEFRNVEVMFFDLFIRNCHIGGIDIRLNSSKRFALLVHARRSSLHCIQTLSLFRPKIEIWATFCSELITFEFLSGTNDELRWGQFCGRQIFHSFPVTLHILTTLRKSAGSASLFCFDYKIFFEWVEVDIRSHENILARSFRQQWPKTEEAGLWPW